MPEQLPLDEAGFALVNCIAAADRDDLASRLAAYGFVSITLYGARVHDKESFLGQAAIDLPCGDLQPHNWDALADVGWNVLYDLQADRVALVWTDAQNMVNGDLQDFLDAVRVLTDVSRSVLQGSGGFPRRTAFLLFLVGEGPQFRSL